MDVSSDKQAGKQFLSAYANALNSADAESIIMFYAEDGIFMADGFRTLSRTDLVRWGSENYLKKVSFHIDYKISEIIIDAPYLFIDATAKATMTDSNAGCRRVKESRDFFVLRKERNEWKIYRYMFNNVTEIAANYH